MRNAYPEIQPGAVLSYSAGSSCFDPETYRTVDTAEDRLARLFQVYPDIAPASSQKQPIVINCYPATMFGKFENAILVDTYLRQATVSRALLLAARHGHPAIIVAQPMPMLEFIVRHMQHGMELPSQLLAVLGGYACPRSAETALSRIVGSAGCSVSVIYAYGMAEVAVGCLMGRQRTTTGQVIYQPALSEIEPVIENGRLLLRIGLGPRSGETHDTGDSAEAHGEGLVISNPPTRLNPQLDQQMADWTTRDWQRRTGYTGRDGARYIYQLRQNALPLRDDELPFYEFAQRFPFSWLDKPDWR